MRSGSIQSVDQTHRLILEELEDRVEHIFAATEDLREAIGDGRTSRQLLESIFRNVHSLKASASSNGLDELPRIAHQFENLLHSLRVGRTTLTDAALQAFDETAEAMFSILRADASVNFEELFNRLQLLSEPTDRGRRLEVDLILHAVPGDIWEALSELEKHRLEQSVGEGANLFLVATRFDITNFDQLFQTLKDKLTEKGELISTAPQVDNELPDKINFRILYTRESDLEQVRSEISNFTDVTVNEISPEQVSAANERQEAQARYRPRPKNDSPLIRVELNELDKLISSTHQLFRDTTACFESALANNRDFRTKVDEVSTSFMKLAAELVSLRMVPIDRVLQRAYRAGRSAAASEAKAIEFSVRGNDLQVDKSLADAISDPLIHLVRNAVDHGIESESERKAGGKNARGVIRIEAFALQGQTRIRVSDDGRGIVPNLVASAAWRRGVIPDGALLDMEQSLRLLFRSGFSTATGVSETSGRGVGLDVVETAIEDVGGAIRVDSKPGFGSVFEIRLPVTFSLLDVVVLRVGKHRYLIDAVQVVSTQRLKESESDSFDTQIDAEVIPSFRIDELLGFEGGGLEPSILLHCNFEKQNSDQTRSLALKVTEPVETEQVLVRNLGSRGGRWFGVAGAAEMRDGTVALLLDLPALTSAASKVT